MTEAEVFKKAGLIVCSNQEVCCSFDSLNAVAALASKDSLSDPPDEENLHCGVLGCWFGDGSFAGVIVDYQRGIFFTTYNEAPERLNGSENLNTELRLFLADELLKQAA